jgi:hypothetical protein
MAPPLDYHSRRTILKRIEQLEAKLTPSKTNTTTDLAHLDQTTHGARSSTLPELCPTRRLALSELDERLAILRVDYDGARTHRHGGFNASINAGPNDSHPDGSNIPGTVDSNNDRWGDHSPSKSVYSWGGPPGTTQETYATDDGPDDHDTRRDEENTSAKLEWRSNVKQDHATPQVSKQ